MNRRLAVVLLLTPVLFGQTKPASRTGTAPGHLFFDAVITGADGRPVPGLTTSDLELTHTGVAQTITSLTWFDNRQHAATPAATGFELSPPDVRRKIVLVVDDLGLTPERVTALQEQLRSFANQLGPDDYAAIVRVGSNRGGLRLTSERRALVAEIESIQPIGGLDSTSIAPAIWESLRSVTEGLRLIPGRKSLVLVSERLDAPFVPAPGQEYFRSSMRLMTQAAMIVFYTLDPRGSAQPPKGSTLAWLVQETGGLPAPGFDAVLRDQEGFYLVGFQPAEEGPSPTAAVLRLRRKVLNLRWRFGYVRQRQPQQEIAPPDRAAVVQNALTGSGDAGAIRATISPLFTGFAGSGAIVEVPVHIDADGLSSVRDLAGKYHISAQIHVASLSDSGTLAEATPKAFAITVNDQEYELFRKEGLRYVARLRLPAAGGYQIRAVVMDDLSDRAGSAAQFLEIPDTNWGHFALSGIVLRRAQTPGQPAVADTVDTVFHRDSPIAFSYAAINATESPSHESRLRVVTRVYASARRLYTGNPTDLAFPGAGARQVNSNLRFDQNLAPGTYMLEVEATDLLSKGAQPRVAIQYAMFEVRE